MITKRFKRLQGVFFGILAVVLLTGTLVAANSVTRESVPGVRVSVDGELMSFDADSQPFLVGDRTYLPLHAIANVMGFGVEWNAEESIAELTSPLLIQPMPMPTIAPLPATNPIIQSEVDEMLASWGRGLVAISTAYAEGREYAAIAQSVLDTLYGYVDGVVLFKPTIASEIPFRFTETQAASYFIGSSIGSAAYEEDGAGFATNPWTAVYFDSEGQTILHGEVALWMGSVWIRNDTGEVIRVEKSMGFYRAGGGELRIMLHHSSVPFE